MKKTVIILILLLGSILITSYKIMKTASLEVLTVLGIQNNDFILNNIFCVTNPNCIVIPPPMANASTLRILATGDKIKVAKEACNYAKAYCNSDEFKTKYQEKRMSMKPYVEQLSDEQKQAFMEQITIQEEMYTPEVLAMLPPEAKQSALQDIENMKAMANGELNEEQKRKWEDEAPADPNTAIKRALTEFLDTTQDVDYNATTKLNPEKNTQVFTNAAYEKKDYQWKACYRAGKEVTDVVRGFAREWISELR